jgi:hypothetical protein
VKKAVRFLVVAILLATLMPTTIAMADGVPQPNCGAKLCKP